MRLKSGVNFQGLAGLGYHRTKADLKGPSQRRFEAMCDELIVFSPGDDVTKTHAEISHELATRVMVKNQ